MPNSSRPRKQRAAVVKKPKVFSPLEVLKWSNTPIEVLGTLSEKKTISDHDLGSLLCFLRIIEGNANALNTPCPNSAAMRGLIKQIDAGMPIQEDRIAAALKWVQQAAKWLRGKPIQVTEGIIEELQAEIRQTVLFKEIEEFRRQMLKLPIVPVMGEA